MKCAFEYCVYNRDFLCVLESIEINSLGMCEACVVISLDEDFLAVQKERQLREMEGR